MSTVDWSHPAEGPAPIPELGARPDAPVAAVLALGANLRDARLYRTDLTRAEFVHANLMGAELRKATLERTNFTRANLYEAVLLGVRGAGTDFTDANLQRVVREPA